MILIADSGSTKTDWACTSENGGNVIRFKSLGYNPNYISGEEIRESKTSSVAWQALCVLIFSENARNSS